MEIAAAAALWFLPFAVPLCLYVAWNDMREMKIPNRAVLVLAAIYAGVGLVALPFETWAWGWVHLAVMLVFGFALNVAGTLGAGDAKFAAAAAPFVALGDVRLVIVLFAACLLAAFAAHRFVRAVPALRGLAPHWKSWTTGESFPMGLALGSTLALYLLLGAAYGR